MIELSLPEARQLAAAALLDGRAPTTVTEVVRALGSVQVDRRRRCARERMVLFSRLGPYDVAELAAALDRGEVFEYWAHIVPTSDYGIHRESMRRYPRGDLTRSRYIREWLAANASFRRYVLREIRRRGPLLSRTSMTAPRCRGRREAGTTASPSAACSTSSGSAARSRSPAARATSASGTPPKAGCRATSPDGPHARSPARSSRVACGARASRRREFGLQLDGVPPGADAAFRSLVRDGTAVPARVTGLDGDWWVHRDVLERGPGDARTVLLSPFDRLVYDRERTAELFGFRYRLEMYVLRRSASSATTSCPSCAARS